MTELELTLTMAMEQLVWCLAEQCRDFCHGRPGSRGIGNRLMAHKETAGSMAAPYTTQMLHNPMGETITFNYNRDDTVPSTILSPLH
jgi:hypothetical protein